MCASLRTLRTALENNRNPFGSWLAKQMEQRDSKTAAFLWTLRLLASFLAFVLCCNAQDSSLDDALAHAKLTYSQQGAKAALPEYQQVLESFQKAGDRHGEAITIGLIGNCYKRLGDYPKALTFLNQALQMKRELHDRPEEGKTLSHLGLLYWDQGAYAKAIEAFNQSISIAREIGDARLEAASLNNLGLVYDEQGDYRRSLEHYNRALDLHRSVKYEPGESDALGNIGGVYLLLGHYSQAETYYRQALDISRRLDLRPSESQDLGNLAQCLLGQGKIQDSLSTYDKAILLANNAGFLKEEADGYRGKASALLRIGKYDDALRNYQMSEEVYSKAGLKRELVENLSDVGNAHLELGDRLGADKCFRKAVAISKEIGNTRGVIVNQLAIAELYRLSREYLAAQKHAETALEQARKIEDSAETIDGLLLMARILQGQHRISLALQKSTEARELANQHGLRLLEGDALDQIGELEVQLRLPEDALLRLETARGIASQSGDVDLLWRSDYHLGQAYERLRQNENALEAYRASVDVIESVRSQITQQSFRTGYFQDKERVYTALIQLLLRMGKSGDAFEYSEQLREYSYQNLSNKPFLIESSPAATEAHSRMVQLQELLGDENNRPAAQQRSATMEFLSEELLDAQKSYELSIRTSSPNPQRAVRTNPAEFARILPADVALIEYLVGDEQLAIFIVTNAGLQTVTQPVRKRNLQSKVELYRDLVSESNSEDQWRKPAESLYSLLIEPLEMRGFLSGMHSLIIVPHGVLNYFPFAALTKNSKGRPSYLIERYEITELPAASFLVEVPANRNGPPQRMVSFAPLNSGLKFAIPEARDVARIFGSNGQAILGYNATKAQFKDTAPYFDVVHVATHGFFNKVNPILSGLQLEPDAADDGRLQVHEILNMHFKAQLITLSACDTALGSADFAEIPAGDEFIGLNRAFLEAGSNSVIASLWKVDDHSTMLVMGSVYRGIKHEGASKALADAQRAMIRSPYYASPYYWAPFVLVGRNLTGASISAEKN
jgi:CHAT domain-containing protein/Tfp pilus assembly protein PilF